MGLCDLRSENRLEHHSKRFLSTLGVTFVQHKEGPIPGKTFDSLFTICEDCHKNYGTTGIVRFSTHVCHKGING